MRRTRAGRAAVVGSAVAGLLLALTACTDDGGRPVAATTTATTTPSATPTSGTASPTTTGTTAVRVARVGVLATLTGDRGAVGRGLRSSVELAVAQANAAHAVPGWRFEVVAVDDGGRQSEGQQVASRLAGTADLVGVVGSLTSAVDEGVQPILNNAGVPMLAPAAGATHLTRRVRGDSVVRSFPTYFRLAPRETAEGVAAARVAARAGRDRVVVVDDGTGYGRGFAADFTAEAARLGVRVVRAAALRPAGSDADLGSDQVLARAERVAERVVRVDRRLRRADRRLGAVVVGGSGRAAAVVATALTEAGARPPVLGGDALLSRDFGVEDGARRGDRAVFAGVTADVPTAASFSRRYLAAGYTDPPGAFGPTGHDATTALLRAFGSVVGDRESISAAVRRDVVAALDDLVVDGATGRLSFDAYGDRVRPRLTELRLTAKGRWRFVGTVAGGPRRSA